MPEAIKLVDKKFNQKVRRLMAAQTAVLVLFLLLFFQKVITVVSCSIALAVPILVTLLVWLIYKREYKEEIRILTLKSFLANLVGYGLGIASGAILEAIVH